MFTLRTLAVALTMLVSTSAFAGKNTPVKPKPAPEVTPFSQLAEAFNNAEPAHIAEIDGMYAGRCFDSSYKSVMLPGLLGQATVEGGPNFPTQEFVFRYFNNDKYSAPDAFDAINTDEEKHELVQLTARVPTSWPVSAAKETEKGIVYTDYYSNTRTPAITVEIRGANGLYFAKVLATASVELPQRSTNGRVSIQPGGVVEYCYYFRQVMTKAEIAKVR